MTHCRRELLHAQWEVLLDEKFVHVYKHGIVVKCCDNITRRFYPRFLTYSADYKEKWVSQLYIWPFLLWENAELPLVASVMAVIASVLAVLYPSSASRT
jgi:hypothetical protein